ncbi:hypothetical protein [Jannaschia aquimarina]|nr:hypothetical protein [Jannaschia aquimarina]
MRTLATLILLAGCGPELPPVDVSVPANVPLRDYPVLQPLDGLLEEGARPSRAAEAQDALRARSAGLRRSRVPEPTGTDLDARADRLRERADALRSAPL